MIVYLLLYLFLISASFHLCQSANTTNYYNQCSYSRCGSSILKFPFGMNTLCSSPYLTTTCENNKVYLTDEESKYIKYQLLENLTEQVYSKRSIKLVDTTLSGCGTIPSFQGLTPNKWVMLGAFHYSENYRTGTFFNCTVEPDGDILPKLLKAPCLECGPTNNVCYFYDGYVDHVDNTCGTFIVHIPVKDFGNFSGVGNLRKVLQQGFEVEWDGDCKSCMQNDVWICGFVDQDWKSGDKYCFCSDGVHKNNCNDGAIVQLDSVGKNPGKNSGKSPVGLIIGIVVGVAAMVLCAMYLLYQWKNNRKQKIRFRGQDEQVLNCHLNGENGSTPASIETFLKNYTLGRPTRFSYKQLKKYTKNFSHKIGQGGFGSVFQGQLPNGFIIAVKVLDESTIQIQAQFLTEVLTIGRIHHNHLVRLLGYCFDQSRTALIYEFMMNGSLEKYIHQKKDTFDGQSRTSLAQAIMQPLSLTWAQLHSIAVGTAKGLAYLHDECQNRILHCDIKPHNILLDGNFQPKVSDFGLAMTLNKENSHISVTQGTGTPGYAPPEMWYVKFGPVTNKSDVYSFGMVVLEMVGKGRNFDVDVSKSSELYSPQQDFSHHVRNAYLGGGGLKWHEFAGEEEEEIATRMELVGLWCIQFDPAKRPAMRKVIDMLEGNIKIPSAPFDSNMPPVAFGSKIKMAPEPNNSEMFGTSECSSAHDSTNSS